MKYLILAFLFWGCCTSLPQGVEEGHTDVHPPAISDSLANSLGYVTREDCKDAVQEAILMMGNFAQSKIDEMGDSIAVTAKLRIDSVSHVADSLKKIKVYVTRTLTVYAQPHDTVITYPVQKIVPMSFWDRVRLACFLPLIILLIGETALFAVYQFVLKDPKGAIQSLLSKS